MKPFIPVSTGVRIQPEGKPGVQKPPHHHPHHSISAQNDPSYSQWHHHDVAASASQMSQLACWYPSNPVQGQGPPSSGPPVFSALPPPFPPFLPPLWAPPPPLPHPSLPSAPPPRPQHFYHQPLDLPPQPPMQQPVRDEQRTKFYSTPAQTLYDSQTLPSPRTMAPHDLTPTSTNPEGHLSPSIQRGAEQIAALLAEETGRMRASFEALVSRMEEELMRERGEKEYLWRRVQELEVELRSLRSSSTVQKREGSR